MAVEAIARLVWTPPTRAEARVEMMETLQGFRADLMRARDFREALAILAHLAEAERRPELTGRGRADPKRAAKMADVQMAAARVYGIVQGVEFVRAAREGAEIDWLNETRGISTQDDERMRRRWDRWARADVRRQVRASGDATMRAIERAWEAGSYAPLLRLIPR